MARLGYRTQNPNAYASIRQVLTAFGASLGGVALKKIYKKGDNKLL